MELSRDLVGAEGASVIPLPLRRANAEALAECAAEFLGRLAAAARPVMLADVELRRYGVERAAAELARRLALPVVTTFMGRGLLSEDNDIVVGTYFGGAGQPAITQLVEESDAPLLMGVLLSDTNFAVSRKKIDTRRAILAINREVFVGHHVYHDIPLAELLNALLDRAVPTQRAGGSFAAAQYAYGLKTDSTPLSASDKCHYRLYGANC